MVTRPPAVVSLTRFTQLAEADSEDALTVDTVQ
jgi:hypothetical protein